MYLLIPLGRVVSPPPRTTGHALPHRLDGLLNVFPGRSATTWHPLVADDFHLEAGRGHYRAALIHRSDQLGISERRAQWIINWTQKIAASTSVNVSTFEEGLGRVMHVVGAPRIRAPLSRTTLQNLVSSSSEFGEVRHRLASNSSCLTSRRSSSSADITHALWKSIRGRRLRELMRKPARRGPGSEAGPG